MIFEGSKLIQNNSIKRPLTLQPFHQPLHILSIDYVDVGICSKGSLSFLCVSNDTGDSEPLQVIPFFSFPTPSTFRHSERSNDQYSSDDTGID